MVLRIGVVKAIAFRTMPHQSGGNAAHVLRILCRNHRLAHLCPERACQFETGHSDFGSGIGVGISFGAGCIGAVRCMHVIVTDLRLGFAQVRLGDAIVIGVLAIAFGDHRQSAAVMRGRLAISVFDIQHLRTASQCGGIMRRVRQLASLIDGQRFGGMDVRFLELALLQQYQSQIGVRRGHVDVGIRIHARRLDDVQRLPELDFRLWQSVRFAVQHGEVIMQRSQASVVGSEVLIGAIQRLMIQILGLIVPLGRAHGSGTIDQRSGPAFGTLKPHVQGQLKRALHDPLVLLVTALRAVEPHRLVKHGQQSGFVSGVFRVDRRLFKIRARLFCGVVGVEDGVEAVEEFVHVKVMQFVAALSRRAVFRRIEIMCVFRLHAEQCLLQPRVHRIIGHT